MQNSNKLSAITQPQSYFEFTRIIDKIISLLVFYTVQSNYPLERKLNITKLKFQDKLASES